MNHYTATRLPARQLQEKKGQNSSLFPVLLILVSVAHILFIVVPCIYFMLNELWADPKPVVLKVGLVE